MFKIVLFDIRILLLSIVLALANVFIYGRDESLLFSVLFGVVLFLAVWVFWIVVNVFVALTTRVSLAEDEKKILVEMTSLQPEGNERASSGMLILTGQHLIFKTYIFTRQKSEIVLPLEDIKIVNLNNLGFIERFQMEVKSRSNPDYRFNIYSGKKWADLLHSVNVKAKVQQK